MWLNVGGWVCALKHLGVGVGRRGNMWVLFVCMHVIGVGGCMGGGVFACVGWSVCVREYRCGWVCM